jgi:hypothetical protein
MHKKDFFYEWKYRFQTAILKATSILFFTFLLGQLFMFLGVFDKPSYKEWCQGTMFLLIGGGLISAGKAAKEKFINKG